MTPLAIAPRFILPSVMQAGFRQTSLLILYQGELVHESYARGMCADTPHVAFSVTKSVLSALTGIAIMHGYIDSVDQFVHSFFPEAGIDDARKYDMTVEHLLLMTSGLQANAFPTSASWRTSDDAGLYNFLVPQAFAPGERFQYCSAANTQTLVGVIERATGQNLLEFAQRHLFGPLGMTSVHWLTTACGSPIGGFGIYMTPRDMLRFGYLYLRDGRWQGRRILPTGWVEASRAESPDNPMSYGYMWWGNARDRRLGGSMEARGFRGQFVTVYHEADLVVVRTGG